MPREKTTKNYQQLQNELSKIMEWFDSDDIQVDEALAKYEKALELIAEIEKYLTTAENKLQKLNAKFVKQ